MSPTVFITQIPTRRDHKTGVIVSLFDKSAVEEHGRAEIIFNNGDHFSDVEDTAHQALSTYDFERGDSVLFVGSTYLITACCFALSNYSEFIWSLRWNHHNNNYERIKMRTK